MFWVKGLVGPHERYQRLRVAEIDDVMRIARQHVYGFKPLSRGLKAQHLITSDSPLLYQPMTGDDHKELPFAVVPMLPLRNTWLGDVHTKLTTAGGLHQLGKAAPRIHVHFQWKRDLLRRQVGQNRWSTASWRSCKPVSPA